MKNEYIRFNWSGNETITKMVKLTKKGKNYRLEDYRRFMLYTTSDTLEFFDSVLCMQWIDDL